MNTIRKRSLFESDEAFDTFGIPKTKNRIAIVLAGVNGSSGGRVAKTQLDDQKPAQFTRTTGGEFVIDNARKQIGKVFSQQETMFVVNERDRLHYQEILFDVPTENLIVQPQDNGATTAILFAALRLAKVNPTAVLAIFPADFHAPDPNEFMRRVKSACAFARRDPNLILIGIKPRNTKSNEEWIELDSSAPVEKHFGIWRVRRFSAEATPEQTQQLLRNGAFVNSSVIVGTVATFLKKIRRYAPGIFERLSLAEAQTGTISEEQSLQSECLSDHPYTDFSRDVLEKITEKLMVIPVQNSLTNAVGIDPQEAVTASDTFINPAPKYYVAGAGAS